MEEILLEYFTKRDDAYLDVMDNKYRKYYTGVTLNYITYDLLKAKFKKSNVAKCLLKLHQESRIKSIYCPNVKNYVFENFKYMAGNFDPQTGQHVGGYYTKGYNLHTYLNQFIKNEKISS
jgi:hypothetical protein